MSAPEKLEVQAERLAPEGEAIARAGGRVVFVPFATPGDKLEVALRSSKSTFARGDISRVLEAGPERISPRCPHHYVPGRAGPCGGCDWQMLAYESQLKHKREIVADCMRRIAKLPEVEVGNTVPSPQPWGYRNKVQVPFGFKGGKVVAGFYSPGSHDIVDFSECPVQPDLSVKIVLEAKKLANDYRWPIYDEDSGRGWLRHLFVRTNADGKALLAVVTKTVDFPRREEFVGSMRRAFPELIAIHQNIQPLKTSVVLGPQWKQTWGAKSIDERVGKFKFSVSPGAFLQVNTGAAEKLYDCAVRAATNGPKFDTALDLYCGAGTLTLWLAGAFAKVIGVEENREAVKDAWRNAEANSVKNARFSIGRAEAVLPKIKRDLTGPCVVVVDPPRMGLSQGALRLLTAQQFKRLVYVSCNPATFARDAAFLSKSGFILRGVQPVDLFPQTSHVELVGRFDRA